ncbi:hypothetical protein HRbin10_00738 [bacterium HR10]|nr:hypothetical protein HRbin10_00738 [bacterium HR10]
MRFTAVSVFAHLPSSAEVLVRFLQQMVVEHGIRRVKGWRILRDEYRLPLGSFPMVASAVVGLIQFSRIIA